MEGKERRLSLSEAADALGISEITARRWIKSGKLRALHPGRNYQIPVSAVEELLDTDPKEAEPLTLDWARAASDAEFYWLIVSAPEEEIDRLDGLSGELVGFVYRGLKRVLAERSGNSFEDHGPEPEPGEYKQMKKRQEALTAEVRRRRPPFARMRMADDGNKCFWFIPPDQREQHRGRVDAFFDGEPYEDVDARGEALLHGEVPALA